ncbi:hypothetical protein DFH08DRAFT_797307 [Mycena albidolilacea]|uniref:Myb-like domain-containing protein n=1 Tax=Mycena albidolilacea TaxID=1033008 RepID=A0AAD7AR15_9AGAR|nr:hypothetical protein DFH08DRAFT_797307 [Mycena albidolilacea]
MPVSTRATRARSAKQDGTVPVELAGSQPPISDDDLDSNYNENEMNDAEGISDDRAAPDSDDDGVDSAENETDDTHQQAHNARSPAWRPWEDRLLVGQVDSDRPFEKPRCTRIEAWDGLAYEIGRSNPSFQRTGEACRARFNVLRKKFKADEARSLQKTGTDEEINDYIETLGELCALFDAGITAAADKSWNKVDMEASAGLELREASMKGLVRRDRLLDIASLPGSSVRERQGQRGTKRKHHLDEDGENRSQSANASNKRRKKKETVFKDIINQRIADDEAKLDACTAREQERHSEQMSVLNKLADGFECMNNRLSLLSEQQEKTNLYLHAQELERREEAIRRREQELGLHECTCFISAPLHVHLIVAIVLARSHLDIYPGCVIAPRIHRNIVDPFPVEVIA